MAKQLGNKLVKCIYHGDSDTLIIYEKDEEGNNFERYIQNPKYDFYITRPKYFQQFSLDYLEDYKLEKRTVPYNQLHKHIAQSLDELEEEVFGEKSTKYMDYYKKYRGRREQNVLFTNPNIFCCDMHIEDFYIMKYNEKYE